MSRPNKISRKVRVCGPRRCAKVDALIDTGASITTMTEALAKILGIERRGGGRLGTAGGTVRATTGMAKVCLSDKGCGCLTGPVAIVGVKGFGEASILVGQDYLEAARAQIDCSKRSIRCRMLRRRG